MSSKDRYLRSRVGQAGEEIAPFSVSRKQYAFFPYGGEKEGKGVMFSRECNQGEVGRHKSSRIYRFYEVDGQYEKRDFSKDRREFDGDEEQWVQVAAN